MRFFSCLNLSISKNLCFGAAAATPCPHFGYALGSAMCCSTALPSPKFLRDLPRRDEMAHIDISRLAAIGSIILTTVNPTARRQRLARTKRCGTRRSHYTFGIFSRRCGNDPWLICFFPAMFNVAPAVMTPRGGHRPRPLPYLAGCTAAAPLFLTEIAHAPRRPKLMEAPDVDAGHFACHAQHAGTFFH